MPDSQLPTPTASCILKLWALEHPVRATEVETDTYMNIYVTYQLSGSMIRELLNNLSHAPHDDSHACACS